MSETKELKANRKGEPSRRPYLSPRILSAEGLEAAAATCDPATAPFGKKFPSPCTTLGS